MCIYLIVSTYFNHQSAGKSNVDFCHVNISKVPVRPNQYFSVVPLTKVKC
jgi:hypothetical protein